jgi:hypothetical protein
MISAVSGASTRIISAPSLNYSAQRKAALVGSGQWAVMTGCGWLVRAVEATLEREGLRNA